MKTTNAICCFWSGEYRWLFFQWKYLRIWLLCCRFVNSNKLKSNSIFIGHLNPTHSTSVAGPIDNYRNVMLAWQKAGLDKLNVEFGGIDYDEAASVVATKHYLSAKDSTFIGHLNPTHSTSVAGLLWFNIRLKHIWCCCFKNTKFSLI